MIFGIPELLLLISFFSPPPLLTLSAEHHHTHHREHYSTTTTNGRQPLDLLDTKYDQRGGLPRGSRRCGFSSLLRVGQVGCNGGAGKWTEVRGEMML